MAKCQSLLSILCLFSLTLLLLLNPAYCQADGPTAPSEKTEDLGPWGSTAVDNILTWRFTLGEGETIKSLVIRSGDIVDAIGFTIQDKNGDITVKEFGNIASNSLTEIPFREGENIVQISGKHAGYRGNSYRRTISQLIISTNLHTRGYGPYGRGSGLFFRDAEDFESPLVNAGTFAGLYGTLGNHTRFVESIGLTINASP